MVKHKNLFLSMLLIVCLGIEVLANPDSFIGIEPFTTTDSIKTPISTLQQSLFKRLQFGLLPRGVKPMLLDSLDSTVCIAVASGSIEQQNTSRFLRFCLKGNSFGGEEIKIIPLNNQPIDDIIELMALKIRTFLEEHVSGKLRISSIPLDCEILLNGVKIGNTPAEIILEKGPYTISINHDYLLTYHDTIEIMPGKETALQATLPFKGYSVKPWIVSASLFTFCTVACWALEANFHKSYLNLDRNVAQSEFNERYNRYKTTNYIRISLINTSILGWGVTTFQIIRNNSLKNRIFGR